VSRTIAELGLSVDLRAEPWRYPGPFLPFSCTQIGDRLVPLEEFDPDGCHLVIAVGSNASPDVMRRKFERNGVSTTMPHLLGRLDGYGLGYSAHVSLAGYVAATPYPAETTTEVVVSALTDEQLHCLDATEPNYDRVTVPSTALHVRPPAELPPVVSIYESKRGVLIDDAGVPLPFGNQYGIFEQLAAWGLLDLSGGVEHTAHTLGTRPDLREQIKESLAAHARQLGDRQFSPVRRPPPAGRF
jgi:hypothetical protein